MLSAFKARPLLELKQRDKSKIESILAYGDRLLVGLSTGSLRIYRINEAIGQDENKHDQSSTEQRPTSQSSEKPIDLLREQEKFSRYKIEQLALVKEANTLLSLSNSHVHLHDLQSYGLQETLSKSKGAITFTVTSNVVKDDSTAVNSIITRLAAAVKRKLLVWTWHDGELEANNLEHTFAVAVKTVTWASATRLVVGLNSNYILFDIESSAVTDVVGPGSIGGAPGQDGGRLGATGVASMGYLGMSAPKPLATKLGEGEVMLARDINTHFIDLQGNSLGRRQVPWPQAPDSIGYSYPYLLALQTVRGSLELRNPETLTMLQSISLPSASQLHIPQPNISLAHAGKGFLVFSDRAIWRMQAQGYESQIDQLVGRGALDEAISLVGMLEDALLKDKAARMRDIKMQKAQLLFDDRKYRDSIDLFIEVNAPPQTVISIYPPSIAGAASSSYEDPSDPPGSPASKASKSSTHKRDNSQQITSDEAGKHPQKSSKLSSGGDSQGTQSAPREPLEEKELKLATEELRGFLVSVRTRMKKVLNSDGTITSDALMEPADAGPGSLLVKMSSNEIEDQKRLLETAKLVDTTLFRAYMAVSPSFAGPLFRIDNFCDPDVVKEKLIEAGRYNDLVDFFYGKKLHREALELLERFGNKEPSSAAPQLAGPQRTVSYLQNLPSELVDLILEFARWPLKKDHDLGMEVFLADTENAESLPRDSVLDYLQSIDENLALKYLEHIVNELNDTTPSFHQRLVDLYIAGIKRKDFPDHEAQDAWKAKTLTFLRTSKSYQAYKALAKLTPDDSNLYEARAIVLSNMGQHKQALDIYVFKLQDPEKAEEYCNQIYLSSTPPNSASPRQPQGARRVSQSTDPEDVQPSIYQNLLSLYLSPPPAHKPQWGPALALLAKHGARMPASSTLDSIPEVLPVKDLESYFRGQIRSSKSVCNEGRVVAGLRGALAFQGEMKLRLGDESGMGGKAGNKGRNRRVVIGEERVCGVCYKRFGGSAVKVMPDNTVVHYGCSAR